MVVTKKTNLKKTEAKMMNVVSTFVKLKSVMMRQGLKAAKAPCPHCKTGFIHGRIAGPKNHFRMWCDHCTVRGIE